MARTASLLGAAIFAIAISSSMAADVPGSRDPAGFKRYQDSQILHYFTSGYSEYHLDRDGGWGKVETIEGELARAVYLVPGDHTSLEIFRNYEDTLSEAGLHQTFELKSDGISVITSYFMEHFFFGPEKYDLSNEPPTYHFAGYADSPYYATYAGERNGKNITVAVVVAEFGEMSWRELGSKTATPVAKGQVVVALDVVTSKAVVNKMVLVKAEDMAQSLAATGSIDLYGIYFDVDKSDIKPESNATLDEIAKLLKIDASLRLEVAGHTDNTGKPDHNLKLSQDRAAAVVNVLTTKYGIDPKRLVAKGYGDTKPVAPNNTDDGRSKNRRVQLRRL